MIAEKKVIALIPARGGSKGVPRKNIRPLLGKPLVAWTIEAAKNSKFIDRTILSSDDQEIIDIAQQYNCEVPFIRPPGLATDEATAIDTARHALESLSETYDYLVLLQPTSPLRTVEDIDMCIKICHSNNVPSCASVSTPGKSPYWMYSIDPQGFLLPLIELPTSKRRQDLPQAYEINGAVYVVNTHWLLSSPSFITTETLAYKMPPNRSFDIDTELDFKIVEMIAKAQKNNDY